jgi:hypothetical protein
MLNPVVATNYFNDLDPLLDKLDLKEKPDQIWNCDETGKNFEHQPVKVIAAKEEKSIIGRTSASSSNITIMACVNAAGRTMPPLFVATKGKTSKSLHSFNTSAAPVGTKWFMQKNGWMTDSIGERWFEEVFLRFVANHHRFCKHSLINILHFQNVYERVVAKSAMICDK